MDVTTPTIASLLKVGKEGRLALSIPVSSLEVPQQTFFRVSLARVGHVTTLRYTEAGKAGLSGLRGGR